MADTIRIVAGRLRQTLEAAAARVEQDLVGGGTRAGGSAPAPGGNNATAPPTPAAGPTPATSAPPPVPPAPGTPGAKPPPSTAAPPPTPPPPGGGGGGGGGGRAPRAPRPGPHHRFPSPFPGAYKAEGPGDSFEWGGDRYTPGPGGEWRRDPEQMRQRRKEAAARRDAEREDAADKRRRSAFLNNTASTAIGVGLGTSLFSIPMTAMHQYLEFSKLQAVVANRFREMGTAAETFATKMGYTPSKAAQIALSLGGTQNTYTESGMNRMLGLARFAGLGQSPEQVFQSVGRFGELSGRRDVGEGTMARLLTLARSRGLGQGRFGEFLHEMTAAAESQFAATGTATDAGALGVVGLPSLIYGADDPRRANDRSVAGGLNSALQSTPGRSLLMRAMGYGRGDISMIEMKKRLDAGIYDPENVVDFFGYLNKIGLNENNRFLAVESLAGGSLKANQIEALVKRFDANGLADYRAMVDQSPDAARKELAATLGNDDAELYGSGGVTALGQSRVTKQEVRESQIESAMLSLGKEISAPAYELTDKLSKMVELTANLIAFLTQWAPKMDGASNTINSGLDYLIQNTEAAGHIREEYVSLPPEQQKMVLENILGVTGSREAVGLPRRR